MVERRITFNTVVALVVILVGVAIWFLVPHQVDEPPSFFGRSSAGISPRLFPMLVAAGLVVTGIFYLVVSLRMHEINTLAQLSLSACLNLAFIVLVMLAYVALLRLIGYVAASALTATSVSLYYGSRDPVGILLVGLAAPVTIYVLFTRFLSVSLPPFPWG